MVKQFFTRIIVPGPVETSALVCALVLPTLRSLGSLRTSGLIFIATVVLVIVVKIVATVLAMILSKTAVGRYVAFTMFPYERMRPGLYRFVWPAATMTGIFAVLAYYGAQQYGVMLGIVAAISVGFFGVAVASYLLRSEREVRTDRESDDRH